jgi:hypothetical protein
MRKALILTLAGVASLVAFSPAAQARDGCGDGWFRNAYGDCRPIHRYYGVRDPYLYGRDRVVVVDPDELDIGTFYPGRGYWTGNGFFMHRSWDGDGWRYW